MVTSAVLQLTVATLYCRVIVAIATPGAWLLPLQSYRMDKGAHP